MLILLDNSQDLAQCEQELAHPVGQLLTPLTRYTLRDPTRPWAIDNGAFAGFDARSFASLLLREGARRADCLFVVVPDVVGSARRTLECFDIMADRIHGWRLALAAQDGQESLPIPWERISAVFIGGTNEFKLGPAAAQIVQAARILGKWVHVGRVNDPNRFLYFEELGVDSIDGTGISRYSHMREAIARKDHQERLPI